MSRFSFIQRAEPHERFARDALDRQIGKCIPLRVEGAERGTAVLIAAKVTADGSEVELTVETSTPTPDWTAQRAAEWESATGRSAWSFGGLRW